jgi:hypothetical protein
MPGGGGGLLLGAHYSSRMKYRFVGLARGGSELWTCFAELLSSCISDQLLRCFHEMVSLHTIPFLSLNFHVQANKKVNHYFLPVLA